MTDTVVNSVSGLAESFDDPKFRASFRGIPLPSRLAKVLTTLDNEDIIHLVVTAEGTYQTTTAIKERNGDGGSLGKRRPEDAFDIVNAWRINRKRVKVPSVEELRGLLEIPFADSEKIPITERMFNALVSEISPKNCSPHDVGTLFKIGEPAPDLLHVIYPAVAHPSPKGGTENAFISHWDDNIRKVLELLIPSGKSIRNSNHCTETRNLCPDFGFLLGTICSFRGVEKGPENPDDPKAELVDKLNWVYDPAPYMLGECSHSVHPHLNCFQCL